MPDLASFPLLKRIFDLFDQVWNMQLYTSGGSTVHLNQLVIALCVLSIGFVLTRRIAAVVGKRLRQIGSIDTNTTYIVEKFFSYMLAIVVVLIALPIAGIPITILTVLTGALAIGVGFGAQNLFNNLISGIIIMMERPIRLGDIVEVNDAEGRVLDIGNRCVRVRRSDGVDVLVPNSFFLEQPVINWTLHDREIRGRVVVGVAYGSPTDRVRDLLFSAATEHERVLKAPKPIVLFHDFGDSALEFHLLFWCRVSRPMDMRTIQSDLRFRIDELFRENRITIAFPQRDIHLDTAAAPLRVQISRDE